MRRLWLCRWGLGPRMMSSKAVIVWPTTGGTGAKVSGFDMPPSYDEASVNAAMGTYAITDAAAEGTAGALAAAAALAVCPHLQCSAAAAAATAVALPVHPCRAPPRCLHSCRPQAVS